jgi:hypothetical protein
VTDPARKNAALTDPNYYRLAYQLAAQQLHAGLAARHDTAPDDLPAYVQEEKIPDASEVADKLIDDTGAMLDSFRGRRERGLRLWIPRVGDYEERLFQFLDGTVEPCAIVLRAAIGRARGSGEGASEVAAVEGRAQADELSYRALYNLACWHADKANNALRYLYRALSGVARRRSPELIFWALRDPSLSPLRDGPRRDAFYDVVKRVFSPETAASQPRADSAEDQREGGRER